MLFRSKTTLSLLCGSICESVVDISITEHYYCITYLITIALLCTFVVFDCCFATDIWEDNEYKIYIRGIVGQLRDHFPDASFMVFNFREAEYQSQIDSILSEYDMTVMDYPRQYEGCPLLTMEMIHHFLRSSESWLSLGQQNVILMHCE